MSTKFASLLRIYKLVFCVRCFLILSKALFDPLAELLFLKGVFSCELCSMSYKDKQRLARSLFIKSDLTRKQIAEQVGCTQKTLRDWIKKFDWDKAKEAETITRSQLLQDAYTQLKAINQIIEEKHNGIPNKELSDAKGVLRKEIEALSEMPLHKYVEVFMELIDWATKNCTENLLDIAAITDRFIGHLAQKKGV